MKQNQAISRDIFRLILPVMMENILQMAATVVVTAMVGRLLADDISAQGVSARLTNLCWTAIKGIGVGVTVNVALRFGQKRFGLCRRITEQSYLTLIPVSFLFIALLSLMPDTFLRFFTQEPDLLEKASGYLHIAVWAIPFQTVSIVNAAAFQGQGDTRTPLLIAIFMNGLNIAIGYGMIFGIGNFEGMGIYGAALTTVLAQMFSAALGLILLYRRTGLFRQNPHGKVFFSLDREAVRSVYATGAPASGENILWQLGSILLSKIMLGYGSSVYAAYQLGVQAEMFFEMPAMGFTIASTTLAARSIGQQDDTLFRGYFKRLRLFALVLGTAASLLLFLLPVPLMGLLTDKQELITLGSKYVFLMGFAQLPQSLVKVYDGTTRAAGYKRVPLFVAAAGVWLVRVPFSMLFAWGLQWDIAFVWGAIAADQIVRILLSTSIFRKKRVIDTVTSHPAGAAG